MPDGLTPPRPDPPATAGAPATTEDGTPPTGPGPVEGSGFPASGATPAVAIPPRAAGASDPMIAAEGAASSGKPKPQPEPARPAAPEAGPTPAPRPRWTLSRRLPAAYAALAVLIVAVVAAFVWSGSRLARERGTALAFADVTRTADRIAAFLDRAEETGAVLAASLPPEPAACSAALEAAALSRPVLSGHMVLLNPERRITCATSRDRVGAPVAPTPPLLTAERTTRPVGATLVPAGTNGPALVTAHPVRRGTRNLGTLMTEIPLSDLRAHVADQPGHGFWLLEPGGASVALNGADPAAPAFDADPLFGPDAAGAGPIVHRVPDGLFVASRLGDDLALLARVPTALVRGTPSLAVLAPPLLLAVLLLAGLALLFWGVGHFVLAPLEAATRRLESDVPLPPDPREARAPAEIADLIARLGAARATRDEAVRLRDMLLREVNHRIKNHLALVASFLRLQERHLSDHAAIQALRTAEGRMRAIALTYELLHEGAGDRVALDRMLLRTARALVSRDANAPGIETDLEPVEVPADIAVKVGLLVNELATNSLKHAFVGRAPGTVRITLRRRGSGFVLRASDDGAGMPVGARHNLGMTVVDNLSRAIGARLERLPGPGTGHEIAWQPTAGAAAG